jgi:hypothetical protein
LSSDVSLQKILQKVSEMLNIGLESEKSEYKWAASNEAVWRNGGISPQKVQCEFGSLPPAGSSV